MTYTIVPVSARPELAPIAARWLVAEFGRPGSRTKKQLTEVILAPPTGPEPLAKRPVASSPGQLIAAIEIARSATLLVANVDAGFK